MSNLNRQQLEDLVQLARNERFPTFKLYLLEEIDFVHEKLETEAFPHQIAQLQGRAQAFRSLINLFESEIPAVLSMPAEKS